MVVDALADYLQISMKRRLFQPYMYGKCRGFDDVEHYVVKPFTFMNNSGRILDSVFRLSHQTPADIVLVCDNMDLPPGEVRIKQRGSSAGHNGIKSIIEYAGRSDFIRVYVGIGRPPSGVSVVEHVLNMPDGQELVLMMEGVRRSAAAVREILKGKDVLKVMNEFNRRVNL